MSILDRKRRLTPDDSTLEASPRLASLDSTLILFDLNETLVHRQYILQPNGQYHQTIEVRPHTLEVIKSLHEHYLLGVASSCTKKNIYSILGTIFAGSGLRWQDYFTFIFDRTYTLPAPREEQPYATKRHFEMIIEEAGSNVIFIDNDEDKYTHTEALRLIVPSYLGGQEDDEVLTTLADSLEALLHC